MAEKHDRKGQAWRQGQRLRAHILNHRHRERDWGKNDRKFRGATPNDILLQAGPRLLNLPKKCHQPGTSVQIPKPMLNIFHLNKHTNTKSLRLRWIPEFLEVTVRMAVRSNVVLLSHQNAIQLCLRSHSLEGALSYSLLCTQLVNINECLHIYISFQLSNELHKLLPSTTYRWGN